MVLDDDKMRKQDNTTVVSGNVGFSASDKRREHTHTHRETHRSEEHTCSNSRRRSVSRASDVQNA